MKKIKHLILFWLFSSSLDGFTQQSEAVYPAGPSYISWRYVSRDTVFITSDTIRCTLIVYYDRGPAILHTKPGFVVIQAGKKDIYLDDKKRLIKPPLKVDHYNAP